MAPPVNHQPLSNWIHGLLQVLAAATKKGYTLLKDYGPRFEVLVFDSNSPTAVQELSAIPGVTAAAESTKIAPIKPVRKLPLGHELKTENAAMNSAIKAARAARTAATAPKRRSRSMLQYGADVCPDGELAVSSRSGAYCTMLRVCVCGGGGCLLQ